MPKELAEQGLPVGEIAHKGERPDNIGRILRRQAARPTFGIDGGEHGNEGQRGPARAMGAAHSGGVSGLSTSAAYETAGRPRTRGHEVHS